MAYADSIRVVTATFNETADLIDGVLATNQQASAGSTVSTSSAIADLPSMNFTISLEATQQILLIATGDAEHSASSGLIDFRLYRNATPIGNYQTIRNQTGGTAGDKHPWGLVYLDTPGAGSFTYKVIFGTGSGTAYVYHRTLVGIILRVP